MVHLVEEPQFPTVFFFFFLNLVFVTNILEPISLMEVIIQGRTSWSNNFRWVNLLNFQRVSFVFPSGPKVNQSSPGVSETAYQIHDQQGEQHTNKKAKLKGGQRRSNRSCHHLYRRVQVDRRLKMSWVNGVCTLQSPGNLSCPNMLHLLPAKPIHLKLFLTESTVPTGNWWGGGA